MPLTSFSCLATLLRTYSNMLNKSSKSEHSFLILNFRGKAFGFSLLTMMLAVGFCRCSSWGSRNASLFLVFWEFCCESVLKIFSMLFCTSLYNCVGFLLYLLIYWITFTFKYWSNRFFFWNESYLVVIHNSYTHKL